VRSYTTVPMIALKDRKSFLKAIRTAKRVASGKRAATACAACKKSRSRCDDTRPCRRCRNSGSCDGCELIEQVPDSLGDMTAVCVREIESFQQPAAQPLIDELKSPLKNQSTFQSDDASAAKALFDMQFGCNFVTGVSDANPAHSSPVVSSLAPPGTTLPNLRTVLSTTSPNMAPYISQTQSSPFLPFHQLQQGHFRNSAFPACHDHWIPSPTGSSLFALSAVQQLIHASLAYTGQPHLPQQRHCMQDPSQHLHLDGLPTYRPL
jgi:hypothetical protein